MSCCQTRQSFWAMVTLTCNFGHPDSSSSDRTAETASYYFFGPPLGITRCSLMRVDGSWTSVCVGTVSDTPPAGRMSRAHNGNFCVTMCILTVLEYLDRAGSSPFAAWFRSLDATAAAKVTTALRRLELGNFSNVKGVGAGVFEHRIDFAPGYRVYFGKDGDCRDSARWRDEEAPGQGHR